MGAEVVKLVILNKQGKRLIKVNDNENIKFSSQRRIKSLVPKYSVQVIVSKMWKLFLE